RPLHARMKALPFAAGVAWGSSAIRVGRPVRTRPPSGRERIPGILPSSRRSVCRGYDGDGGIAMPATTITWYGHSCIEVVTGGGKTILFDPWFGNPTSPKPAADVAACDVMLVTHGHH